MGGNSEARTELSILRAMAVVRFAQLAPFLAVLIFSDLDNYHHAGAVLTLWLVAVAWTVVLFGHALKSHRMVGKALALDVLFIMVMVYTVGRLCLPGHAATWDNWTVAPMFGAALVVAAFRSRMDTIAVLAMLLAAYVLGARDDFAAGVGPLSIAGNVASLVAFTAVTRIVVKLLRSSAKEADVRAHQAALARQAAAASEARFHERTTHYRILHDTVLSTLSLIARGGLDHRTVQVQERCASDADYLRGLITGAADSVPTTFGSRLSAVGKEPAAFGLRVHAQFQEMPPQVPNDVVEAFEGIAREALNNVLKHAGVSEAWLTATYDDDRITVTIADQGVGFDPDAVTRGTGLARSIRDRARAVDARVEIVSSAGEGTCVEVQWP